jgi:low affinity Fe/Cu permease
LKIFYATHTILRVAFAEAILQVRVRGRIRHSTDVAKVFITFIHTVEVTVTDVLLQNTCAIRAAIEMRRTARALRGVLTKDKILGW